MIGNALQENILILLTFYDDVAPVIISNIKPEMFGNLYFRNIAEKAIDFYKQFKTTPKEHIADLLENELRDTNSKELYTTLLKALYDNKDSIHKDYVLQSLEKFVKGQNLKIAIKGAVEALQKDDIEGAEKLLESSRKSNLALFEPGTFFLKDFERSISFFDKLNTDNIIYTGITALDDLELCPMPNELYIFVGRSSAGKSWFLIHLAKFALMQKKKILHISLELDEERLKSRYFQSIFGIFGKIAELQKFNYIFKTDKLGDLVDIEQKELIDMKSMRDKDIIPYLASKVHVFRNPNLILRYFHTGTLTIDNLKSYLDNLESFYNFVPDMILLDYLDLMKVRQDNYRLDLGQTAVDLRGIASERGIAMVTVAQTNAKAELRGLITRKNLAEDFSKVRVADNLVIYNATRGEQKAGLARLYIDKARNTREGDIIMINQNYSIGQFCLSSRRWHKNYWDILKNKGLGKDSDE